MPKHRDSFKFCKESQIVHTKLQWPPVGVFAGFECKVLFIHV